MAFETVDRRSFVRSSILALAGLSLAGCRSCCDATLGRKRRYALNPPTLKGYGLSFRQQVALAIEAGFDGLEPWLRDVYAAKRSGEFADAVKMANDAGLRFVNGIAFGTWVDSDLQKRTAGLAETRRDMEILAEMGCPSIAASMFGSHKLGSPILSLDVIAERYAAVCALGKETGVRPLLEYWGHSVNLHTPEDALAVVARVACDNAGILPDVYHTYRGGGRFETFRFFSDATVPVLHMNDYPAQPTAERLVDADRIWPGDGVAPWTRIVAALDEANCNPWLSIELFNPNYWKTSPQETIRTALRKMQEVMA